MSVSIIIFVVIVIASPPIIHGLYDGITEKNKYRSFYCGNDEKPENTEVLEEIAHLESMVQRYNEIAVNLENELESTSNTKKRNILLSKLNTIDNKTFTARKRIKKLKDSLE